MDLSCLFYVNRTSDNQRLCKFNPRPLVRGRGFVDNFIYK